MKDKLITFDCEHIFRGKQVVNSEGQLIKISGFHHDMCKVIEKTGRIQNVPLEILEKNKYRGGFYKWSLKSRNKTRQKSFFPNNWTRKQVMSKIMEACKYAQKNNTKFELLDNGYLRLMGKTRENFKIQLLFNKAGTIITAYPIIKR